MELETKDMSFVDKDGYVGEMNINKLIKELIAHQRAGFTSVHLHAGGYDGEIDFYVSKEL